MKTILRYYKNRYDTIVAFKPTGWTFEAAKKHARAWRTQRGAMIQYSVPYSEHSSFDELRAFVKFLKPQRAAARRERSGAEGEADGAAPDCSG